ncbi:MAG TPA: Rnf-Nqr domain containing protein [Bacilli bacterium]|jgi:electron transport complex protein RnfA|nr:MAG: Electron transport complex protein RnfA [Tenericutes bacterium ADurb.Bin140]HOE78214.1 Rnf-Nqr domain containing protein [Bacilli bacterium]HOR96516.1 Rnf-Nqr domain containing protein [Bacilli bacterium]HPK58958.1 Rnf-Nqr domain containing protein [Bacilli bacterium]HRU49299.1 Rnf-Nqr domain containing protein [Bacilli bacterium]
MANLITLAFGALLIENVLLYRFLGFCPFLGVSKKRSSAVGMGLAVIVVIVLATIVTWALYHYVLKPLDIVYLQTLTFILVIAALVQMVEMFLKKVVPPLYRSLGIYLPLITTNCAVLGVASLVIAYEYDFLSMLIFSFFSSVGFFLVLYIFSGLREAMEQAPIPKPFKGTPIALIATAALALIFARLGGII